MGCIPGGGSIELELKLCPATVGCFDVKVCIHIRSSKTIFVRLSGSVEHPKITVTKVHGNVDFHFVQLITFVTSSSRKCLILEVFCVDQKQPFLTL